MKEYKLADEEIEHIIATALGDNPHWQPDAWGLFSEVAHTAQKKLLEYLISPCPHVDEDLGGEGVTNCFRFACSLCMGLLIKAFDL